MTYIPHHFTCSVCGAPKREINHWFLGHETVSRPGARFTTWNEPDAQSGTAVHLCGSECLLKWIGRKAGELNR